MRRPVIDTIVLYCVSAQRAVASVHFAGITIREIQCYRPGGRILIEMPTYQDPRGNTQVVCQLSKALQGDISREIECLWKEAERTGVKTVSTDMWKART